MGDNGAVPSDRVGGPVITPHADASRGAQCQQKGQRDELGVNESATANMRAGRERLLVRVRALQLGEARAAVCSHLAPEKVVYELHEA